MYAVFLNNPIGDAAVEKIDLGTDFRLMGQIKSRKNYCVNGNNRLSLQSV